MKNSPKLRFPEFLNDREWEEKPINQVCKINPSTKDLPSKFVYIDLESVDSGVLLQKKIIDLDNAPSRAQRLLQQEDIIFQMVRPYQKNNYFFDIKDRYDYVASTGYAQLRAYQSKKYLFHFLHSDNFVNNVLNKCTGSNYPAINSTDLSEIIINIPKPEEQQKIADCLSSVDSLISAQSQKAELLKEHKKALMQQLFPQDGEEAPKLRFPEFKNAPKWEEKTLGDVGKVSMCKRIMKDETTETGEIPFYKIGTFGKKADAYIDKELYEDYRKKYSFPKKGDILISASGTIGRLVVFDGLPAYFQDSNIVWIANNEELVKNSFLSFFYETVKWTTSDTTIARLYNDNLRSVQILIPSIKEQQKIADCLSSINEQIGSQAKKLQTLKEHKKALMQQLFPSAKES